MTPGSLLVPAMMVIRLATVHAHAQHCIATPTSMTPGGWNATTTAAPNAPRGPLQPVQDIPLPGPANRFDYQSVDPVARRLYINHMNAGRLVVFDLDSAKVIGEVPGLDRATGVWAVPAHRMVYVHHAVRGNRPDAGGPVEPRDLSDHLRGVEVEDHQASGVHVIDVQAPRHRIDTLVV